MALEYRVDYPKECQVWEGMGFELVYKTKGGRGVTQAKGCTSRSVL